jgi:anaerobic dimethyl sulfoxide reductase subunit B (iron-sulfur subunit)
MQLGFYFDQTRCIGCHTCAVACKDWHDVPAGPASWLKIHGIEEGTFPNVFVAHMVRPCYHCEAPPCVKACPVSAIRKSSETGIVTVDREACLGQAECGICREACPYDAPQFGEEAAAKMQKCDLCAERWKQGRKPVCVEACLMRCLEAGPLEELRAKRGTGREAAGFLYRPEVRPSVIMKARRRPVPSSVLGW